MGTGWLLSVWVVYLWGHVAGWELQVPVAAQQHEGVVSPNTSPGGEKNQNLKFEIPFVLHVYCFCTVVKSKS